MNLRGKLDAIIQSDVFNLIHNNKPIGFRIKVFNVRSDRFEYYDFSFSVVEAVCSIDLIEYLKSIQKSLPCILLESRNGILVSKEELDGLISSQELEVDNPKTKTILPSSLKQIKYVRENR